MHKNIIFSNGLNYFQKQFTNHYNDTSINLDHTPMKVQSNHKKSFCGFVANFEQMLQSSRHGIIMFC
jgi:hypothetical protein